MKSKIVMSAVLLVISAAAVIFMFNAYFLYKTPIVRVTSVESEYGEGENLVQHVTGKVMNGEHKGNTVTFDNPATYSGVYEEQYRKGNEIFVSLSEDGQEVAQVEVIRRDRFLFLLAVLMADLIVIVGGIKGVKTLITLTVNIGIATAAVLICIKNITTVKLIPVFLPAAFLFIAFSLTVCGGFGKKTLAAVVSSFAALLVSFGLSAAVLEICESSIYYLNVGFIETVNDYKGMLYLSVMLCGLGAIMDISVTMSSSLWELIEKDGDIGFSALKSSGREISKDILGTMTNVMLYTCFVSVIPTAILTLRNGMSLAEVIDVFGQIEMIRILTSCISIVLAIPVSLYVSLFVYRGVKYGG